MVECLLGTGATGVAKEPIATLIREANRFTGFRIAIDIPAGLDCDTGVASEPTFQADLTCTFVAPKIGFGQADGLRVIGELRVVSIGVRRSYWTVFHARRSGTRQCSDKATTHCEFEPQCEALAKHAGWKHQEHRRHRNSRRDHRDQQSPARCAKRLTC